MLAYYSLGPVYDNAGPIHLVVSYIGKVYLSVTTCREIVPDIERYVACLRRRGTSWSRPRSDRPVPDGRCALAGPARSAKRAAPRMWKPGGRREPALWTRPPTAATRSRKKAAAPAALPRKRPATTRKTQR